MSFSVVVRWTNRYCSSVARHRHFRMRRVRKCFLATVLAIPSLVGQPARVVRLEVQVDNMVSYRVDVADPSKFAAEPRAVTPIPNRAFLEVVGIGDITAVNGKPAKGVWTNRGTLLSFATNPAPGSAVANINTSPGNSPVECAWELYTEDGTLVGRLIDGGVGSHIISGGAGAFFGAHGEHRTGPRGYPVPIRAASVAEDPSLRRTLGGGSWQAYIYLVLPVWPDVEMTSQGPAVYHADDYTQVTASKPARAGEVLIARAKGLGPTKPNLMPVGLQPFSAVAPFEEVNSPIEVTVNGSATELISKIGWPGELDVYWVAFRMPGSISPGTAKLQLTAAWIPGSEVGIPVK
jgi:hypothetical protein